MRGCARHGSQVLTTRGSEVVRRITALPALVVRWFRGDRTRFSEVRYPCARSRSYYQHVHQTNEAYKINNWLISEIAAILSVEPKSVLEVGCGNGRFLAAIKDRVQRVVGVDWAESPMLTQLGISDLFERCDITRDELPKVDLVCSADVLEHIAPELLPSTIRRLHSAGTEQYHVIACYDDGHSHLTVMEPQMWLRAFRAVSERYRIIDTRFRRDDPSQPICVISTFEPGC
jgi:SAM-dependent methyltransferase